MTNLIGLTPSAGAPMAACPSECVARQNIQQESDLTNRASRQARKYPPLHTASCVLYAQIYTVVIKVFIKQIYRAHNYVVYYHSGSG